MKRKHRRRLWGATAIALMAVAALAAWQFQALARLFIVAAVQATAHVRISYDTAQLSFSRAVFEGVRVTSLRDEPIASIARLSIDYDLRDLLPGGQRLFGLKSVAVDTPHVTIVRYPDGSYNVPIPQLAAKNAAAQPPAIFRAAVRNGSAEVIDRARDAPSGGRRLYVDDATLAADVSTASRSTYTAGFRYGERPDRLYPVRGRGDVDVANGYVDHHWTAAELPMAAAANVVVASSTLRFESGMLRGVDVRYAGLGAAGETIRPHLAASALLDSGRLAIAGLAAPVDGVRGRVDGYDDGLTTALDANLSGVPAHVSGGLYGLRDPHLRLTVRGAGDLARLRSAFSQAERLPMRGPIAFKLLVEGPARTSTSWIDLRSPGIEYASASVERLSGLVAFDGREADVVRLAATYRGTSASAGGRIVMHKQPNAIEMLLAARAPAGAIPYGNALLPGVMLNGVALANADDPKNVGMRGVLWGAAPARSVDALFDVTGRGVGSIGPLYATANGGTFYARVALDRPHDSLVGLVAARRLRILPAQPAVNATFFGGVTKGQLRGAVAGGAGSQISFAATASGAPQSPAIAGSFVVAGGRYRNFDVNGGAILDYAHGSMQIRDAAAAVGPLFVAVAGTVGGLSPSAPLAPRYDLAVQLHSSDVSTLLDAVQPQAAALVQGSIDADARVRGVAASPSFAGTMSAPEGSVNGLSFRDLRGSVRGNRAALAVSDGRVVVGSSAIGFGATTTLGESAVDVSAPRLDLADLNDFFDAGDTFGGTGSLALRARVRGTRLLSSDGRARFTGARYHRLALGTVAADWKSSGKAIATNASFGGPTGEVVVSGSVDPAAMAVNMRATAKNVDLGTWIPMLDYNFPVTGRLDAQTSLSGRYPDVGLQLHANVKDGTIGHLPLEKFEVTASAAHGRGTIASAVLDVPSLSTTASGTFGLQRGDPLALVVNTTSTDIGAFLTGAKLKFGDVGGRLDSVLRVGGTASAPLLRDQLTLQSARYGKLTVPRVTAEIDADRHSLAVRNGEIDLDRGKALIAAAVPIRVTGSGVAPGNGRISASLTAQDVELSNFAPLLPNGTKIAGHIDGGVNAGGTIAAPLLNGSFALRDGAFNGPIERAPITAIGAELSLAGSQARLQSRATVGGGSLTAVGSATLADLRRPAEAAFNMNVAMQNARLDIPNYFQGNLDATLAVAGRQADPSVSGSVNVSNARIPLTAFINQKPGASPAPSLPDIAFDGLRISVGNNVRVQSANVDIGGTGDVTVGGTLRAPSLVGEVRSTGGSLNFYRSFNLESGRVEFAASSGLIPRIDAVATTFIPSPATAVRLHVTGPATEMNLELASEPSYSRQQILGLLVGAQNFGALQGVQGSSGNFSAGSAIAGVGLGQLNTLFARNLLQPLSSSLASALGFTTVQITTDIQTGIGLSAAKALGKNTRAIYSQSFGFPKTQAITLETDPDPAQSVRLNWYTSTGPTLLSLQTPQPVGMDVMNLNRITMLPPFTGTNGVSLSYVRKFP